MKSCGVQGVDAKMIANGHRAQVMRRKLFTKQLLCLKMLLRQGLPTRGHNEMEGNLRQLLLLTARDDRELQQWIDNGKYLAVR